MRVVTPEQMRRLDRATIEGGTPGPVLMERAGRGLVTAMWRLVPRLGSRPILILCGTGNNGGDGFVAARLLRERDLNPEIVLLGDREKLRGDAEQAFRRLLADGARPRCAPDPAGLDDVERRWRVMHQPVLVDALLGTGSRGAPRGGVGRAVQLIGRIAESGNTFVVAVDAPTGIDSETGEVPGDVVSARLTVTMAFPKTGFLFYPARLHTGRIATVDIGIRESGLRDAGGGAGETAGPLSDAAIEVLTAPEAKELLPERPPDAHKGDAGRVVLVGGSPGLTGAAVLASDAAMAAGAGLATAAVPSSLNPIFEAKLTEAMTLPLPETDRCCLAPEGVDVLTAGRPWDAWGVGPGLGRYPEAMDLVGRVYGLGEPLVVDADALFALAESGPAAWPGREGPPAIFTPHYGEMARLAGTTIDDVRSRPVEWAARAARDWRCIVVLKGGPTVVADPAGRISINPTGNPGMASGGMGDVLTGVLVALLGQRLEPFDAARLGVYLHGLAGDLAAEDLGRFSLKAGDVTRYLSSSFRKLGRPASEFEESLVTGRI